MVLFAKEPQTMPWAIVFKIGIPDSKLLHCTSLANKFSVQYKFGPLHQLSFRFTRDPCKDKDVLKTITLGKQPGPQHLMTP